MNKKQWITTTLLVVGLLSPSFANPGRSLSFSGGTATFDDNFENGTQFFWNYSVENVDGLGFDFGIGYLNAKGNDSNPELKLAPFVVGGHYTLLPKSSIQPYIGGMGAIALTSSSFDSPLIGYGLKAGLNFEISPKSALYVEAMKLYFEDSLTDLAIEPTLISAGIKVRLANPKKAAIRANGSNVPPKKIKAAKAKRKALHKRAIRKTRK